MNSIKCPYCLGNNVKPNDKAFENDFEYKCLTCNKFFHTPSKKPYHKMVTLKYTINKSLVFPKLNVEIAGEDIYSRCLFGAVPDTLDCDNIDCDDCIFGKENYKMYTDVKEEKKGE